MLRPIGMHFHLSAAAELEIEKNKLTQPKTTPHEFLLSEESFLTSWKNEVKEFLQTPGKSSHTQLAKAMAVLKICQKNQWKIAIIESLELNEALWSRLPDELKYPWGLSFARAFLDFPELGLTWLDHMREQGSFSHLDNEKTIDLLQLIEQLREKIHKKALHYGKKKGEIIYSRHLRIASLLLKSLWQNLSREDNPEAEFSQIMVLMESGRYHEALDIFQVILLEYPELEDGLFAPWIKKTKTSLPNIIYPKTSIRPNYYISP